MATSGAEDVSVAIGGGTGDGGSGLAGRGTAMRLRSACSAACFRVRSGEPVTACSWKCSSAVTASTDSSIVCQRHHRLLQPLLPGLRAFMASGRSERPRGASVHTRSALLACPLSDRLPTRSRAQVRCVERNVGSGRGCQCLLPHGFTMPPSPLFSPLFVAKSRPSPSATLRLGSPLDGALVERALALHGVRRPRPAQLADLVPVGPAGDLCCALRGPRGAAHRAVAVAPGVGRAAVCNGGSGGCRCVRHDAPLSA